MSLDFDYSKIQNKDVLFKYGPINPDHPGAGNDYPAEARSVVFATMAVGIGHITEKNYIEFSMRCQAFGGMSEFGPEPYNGMTPEVIQKYIGLRTNVSDEPLTKWFKRVFDGSLMTATWKETRRLRELDEQPA